MRVTLTGVDRKTDLKSLPKYCEIGLLLSATNTGNRYFNEIEIFEVARDVSKTHHVAIHVCGQVAKDKLFSDKDYLSEACRYAGRIQVNGIVGSADLHYLCRHRHGLGIITQHTKMNQHLIYNDNVSHQVLVDASGGRGVLPDKWTRPDTIKRVGFAGGLSPDNLFGELNLIEKVAFEPYWVDMESSLRDENDWFDVSKADEVMSEFGRWLKNEQESVKMH